jgi:hypothetical protein
MQPRYVAFLTVTPVPGTPLFDDLKEGKFRLPTPMESLRELRWIVEDLELSGSIFAANHASNYLPLRGRLPADRDRILGVIDAALTGELALRPEHLRAL